MGNSSKSKGQNVINNKSIFTNLVQLQTQRQKKDNKSDASTEEILPNSFKGDILCWISRSKGEFPETAIEAGKEDGKVSYVARAMHENDLIPGKLIPSDGAAYVSQMGEVFRKEEYQVLCNTNLNGIRTWSWQSSSHGNIPRKPFPGGINRFDEILYIGRVIHNGSIFVGKVHPSLLMMFYPCGDKELDSTEYEVLAEEIVNQ